jgi:hypothetical protein
LIAGLASPIGGPRVAGPEATGGFMQFRIPPVLPADDFVRPTDLSRTHELSVRYSRSYLLIRAVVGFLGVLLPLTFFIGEAFIAQSVEFRGSISAYYHSPIRDVFVGGLCVIGFLLIVYLSGGQGMDSRWDRLLSTVAGVSLLLVVFLPTRRPGIEKGAPLCGDTPEPPLCSAVQQRFGETLVATLHFTFAFLFILSLAVICFYWGARDVERRKKTAAGRDERRWKLWQGGRAVVHGICGILIVLGAVWVALRIAVWKLKPLYVGEVISIWSFGAAWLYSSWDLWKELIPGMKAGSVAAPTSKPPMTGSD